MPLKHACARPFWRLALVLLSACLAHVCSSARGEDTPDAQAAQIQKFTDEELRALVAPIALYPDALLAQVLPASTFPLDIVSAYRYSQSSRDPANPPSDATWDSSVIALLHYPAVLKRMNDDLSWTERLGVAVTYQMADVSATIQQVRAEAEAAGNLASNDKQIVTDEPDAITIVPADPQIIYVPVYDPDVIFVHHDSWEPYISFGTGFRIGLWLTNDFDWHYHRIGIHNQWHDGGWKHQSGYNYWHAPPRPIPTWYSKGGVHTPGPTANYGHRPGSNIPEGHRPGANIPEGQKTRIPPPAHSASRPAPPQQQPQHPPPARTAAPARPAVTPRPSPAPLTHAEGLGSAGQQVKREATRGEVSRQNVQPVRQAQPARQTQPVRQAPVQQPRPAQNQNMMRPSSGPQTSTESSRGASSRGRR